MLHETTISFIGSGVMAEAMIKGVLDQRLTSSDRILAAGPRADRGYALSERYGIHSTTSNLEAARASEIVVFSVKPQVLPKVLRELNGHIAPETLVLSIAAGTRILAISRGLGGHQAIVRAMPNTPAQLGKGITVWTSTPQVSEVQRQQADQMLSALGEAIWMEDEAYLDMATALSGTGPAYVFLFIEALIDAGVHLGFSRRVAEQLVLQTMEGSLAVARTSARHPATLRNMVTSPGGTTAEALYQLEKGGLRTIVSKAVYAAYQKSKLLGELSEK
ncbi:MAG: pyrroline-5-carboxylate reductase [Anaerolineae bacterium]